MTDIQKIIAALPKLSQTELAQIRGMVDQLMIGQIEAVDETTPLFDALKRLVNTRLNFRDFHNVPAYKTWRKSAPLVVAFIEKTFPKAGRVAKRAMMTFMLEALIDDLKSRGVPISLGRVTYNLDRLPHVFDEMFPDYRQSGMSHLVLEAMLKKRE